MSYIIQGTGLENPPFQMKGMELIDLYDIVFKDKIKKYIDLSLVGSSYSSEEIIRIIKNIILKQGYSFLIAFMYIIAKTKDLTKSIDEQEEEAHQEHLDDDLEDPLLPDEELKDIDTKEEFYIFLEQNFTISKIEDYPRLLAYKDYIKSSDSTILEANLNFVDLILSFFQNEYTNIEKENNYEELIEIDNIEEIDNMNAIAKNKIKQSSDKIYQINYSAIYNRTRDNYVSGGPFNLEQFLIEDNLISNEGE